MDRFDTYAVQERLAIQAEQPTPDAELIAFLRKIGHENAAERLESCMREEKTTVCM